MASRKPSYIQKNWSIGLDGEVELGNCQSVTLPVIERTMEEFRNAGMIKPREVAMGYEMTSLTLTKTSFDPDTMRLYGIVGGSHRSIIIYGHLESEDGREHQARIECVADFKKFDPGDWASAEKSETEYELAVHEGRILIDNSETFRWDDFNMWINGVQQQPGKAAALREI